MIQGLRAQLAFKNFSDALFMHFEELRGSECGRMVAGSFQRDGRAFRRARVAQIKTMLDPNAITICGHGPAKKDVARCTATNFNRQFSRNAQSSAPGSCHVKNVARPQSVDENAVEIVRNRWSLRILVVRGYKPEFAVQNSGSSRPWIR